MILEIKTNTDINFWYVMVYPIKFIFQVINNLFLHQIKLDDNQSRRNIMISLSLYISFNIKLNSLCFKFDFYIQIYILILISRIGSKIFYLLRTNILYTKKHIYKMKFFLFTFEIFKYIYIYFILRKFFI